MKAKRKLDEIKPLLPKIKQAIQDLYGDRLVRVILYGSFARGKATEDSDIDIAVVLKGEVDKVPDMNRVSDPIYDLMLDTGELITVLPLSESEMENQVWPLYYWIRKEGIEL